MRHRGWQVIFVALVLAGVLLCSAANPAAVHADPPDDSKAWPAVVDEIGDLAGISTSFAGLILNADSKWILRANGAFLGWKLGGLAEQGKYKELAATFLKFNAETLVGKLPVAPYYTALTLYITALKTGRGLIVRRMYGNLWNTYVRYRAEQRWDESTSWGVVYKMGMERWVRLWPPKDLGDLHEHFKQRFDAEYDENLQKRIRSGGSRELSKLAQEVKERVIRFRVIAIRPDGSHLPDAKITADGPGLQQVSSGYKGVAAFNLPLVLVDLSGNYQFEAESLGKKGTSSVRGDIVALNVMRLREMIYGRKVTIDLPPEEPPVDDDLDDIVGGVNERSVLIRPTGSFAGGAFGSGDPEWGRHQAQAVRAFDAGPLEEPGTVYARLVRCTQIPLVSIPRAMGRVPSTTVGVELPDGKGMRWGMNVPSGPLPKGTKIRLVIEQDWRNGAIDAVFFPCTWTAHLYFVPAVGATQDAGDVTDVQSDDDDEDEPRYGEVRLSVSGGEDTLPADGKSSCILWARWSTFGGNPAGGVPLQTSRVLMGRVEVVGSSTTDHAGFMRFRWTAPTAEDLRMFLKQMNRSELRSGRFRISVREPRTKAKASVKVRFLLPDEDGK